MQALIDAVQSIIESISTVLDFLWSTITDTVYMVNLLLDYTTRFPLYFKWLPDECVVILGSVLGILVILRILGRDD